MSSFGRLVQTPEVLGQSFPGGVWKEQIADYRDQVIKILNQEDHRLLVIVGPCSIHNLEEAYQYAQELKELANRHQDYLLVVMRTYFEKPRTSLGWKGLIHDPCLDGSCQIGLGLEKAREFLWKIAELGLPCATEFLDLLTPHYLADLITWGCIGARTVESQTHRQMASGLPMPVGFKNGTTGSVKIAVDAIIASSASHSYLDLGWVQNESEDSKSGDNRKRSYDNSLGVRRTSGNPNGHLVLRGGWDGPTVRPNYYMEDIQRVSQLLQYAGLKQSVVVDCSHGNSRKNHRNQPMVAEYLANHISKGNENIVGVMIESNLEEGRQDLVLGSADQLKKGVSITDACLGIRETEEVLENLAMAVKHRRHLMLG